jgi:predicted RNA-binding Zn-ribbon protein involved in translation (DUF1610 family)
MAATLQCPNCGKAMNRHAEKTVHDPDREGAVSSVYYCPGCGRATAPPQLAVKTFRLD